MIAVVEALRFLKSWELVRRVITGGIRKKKEVW